MAMAIQTHAQDWSDFATVSMTNPTTPKLTANRLCYTDGRDLLCDSAAGLLVTSGTIAITGISATNISTTNLTVNGVAITGNASGDRITSGTASAIANGSSGYISLTTGATTWGYLGSSATFLPTLNGTTSSFTTVKAGTISTSVIQVGTSTLTCASATSGTMRYSTTSSTMEYCNGTAWTSMGPSSTIVPSFRARRTTTQALTASTATKIAWDTEDFDPNNNFSTGTFTATIPGTYIFTASALLNGTSYSNPEMYIYKNGLNACSSGLGMSSAAVTVTNLNVVCVLNITAGDTVEAWAYVNASGAQVYNLYNQFSGSLLTMGGGGSGGGTATPAGSTADVQYNSAGALAADTGLFTYASGVLKAPTVSATNVYASSVSGTTGSFSSLGVSNVAASGNVSISGVVKIGTTAATCATGISGTIRYNTASNTMEYCNGSAWANLGPSATTPIAFSVNKGGTNQTVPTATDTLLTWSTKAFDTNNNFSSNRFTPTVPGKFIFTLDVGCADAAGYCGAYLHKNGVKVAMSQSPNDSTAVKNVVAILDMNGSSDYVEAYVYNGGGTTINGSSATTSFAGAILSSQGGGSGGTTSPAGSDTQLQFNNSGSFGASSNLTFDSSARNLAVSGSVQYGGTGSETCSSAADYGKNRRNPTSGRMQVCLFR
ncbi:hypothetical protein [Rhodopseudomonas sp. RCAM05734]|uniref:hypothetical protein n=1 Tax=Rhodopseudomonas sp. RCAM05734 TaxID=3457549 RepID=UPI004044E19D